MNLISKARYLRKHMTHEEVKLWIQLKHLNAKGWNFRRQAPTDSYILDFAEFDFKLIIEVDGSQHGEGKTKARDEIRDAHFVEKGFTVLRFWNNQINYEMDGVIDHILSVLPESPLRPTGTSPSGEDKKNALPSSSPEGGVARSAGGEKSLNLNLE